MIPPAEFIPLAEEIGLIVPLGDWIIRRACEDAATWPRDQGRHQPVADPDGQPQSRAVDRADPGGDAGGPAAV